MCESKPFRWLITGHSKCHCTISYKVWKVTHWQITRAWHLLQPPLILSRDQVSLIQETIVFSLDPPFYHPLSQVCAHVETLLTPTHARCLVRSTSTTRPNIISCRALGNTKRKHIFPKNFFTSHEMKKRVSGKNKNTRTGLHYVPTGWGPTNAARSTEAPGDNLPLISTIIGV